jgi:hypothetical protein
MRKELTLAISSITILAVLTTASMSLPTVYAKKHHLSDTQKEDSTASDSQGVPCTFGPHHDECRDQHLESEGFAPPGEGKHFGECQPAPADKGGKDCEIVDN